MGRLDCSGTGDERTDAGDDPGSPVREPAMRVGDGMTTISSSPPTVNDTARLISINNKRLGAGRVERQQIMFGDLGHRYCHWPLTEVQKMDISVDFSPMI